MARYKVLRGSHFEGGQRLESGKGKSELKVYRKGDIVETDTDLMAQNAKGVPLKFEKVSDGPRGKQSAKAAQA